MKPVVFLGPTLTVAAAGRLLAADYRPPARQGDLFRAAAAGVPAIGLIDGVFGEGPSVWHREVLWALARGTPVYGAASMGALRAAELAAFGMVGVGRIFRAYRSGALEADDAVAVTHAPAELASRPLSEALVDLQATLAAAARRGVVPGAVARRLALELAELHFPSRSYPRLLELAAEAGVPAGQRRALARFVATARVHRKAEDAAALLRRMRRDQRRGWPLPATGFVFAETTHWREALRDWGVGEAGAGVPGLYPPQQLR